MSQLLTLFWLRYVVFKNSLTRRRDVATTIFNVLIFCGYLLFWTAVGTSLFLAVVYFQEFRHIALTGGMTLLLGMMLFFMLVSQSTGTSAHFDPRRYILFPIPLGKLFALNLVSALAEVVMVTVLPIVAGLLLGLGVGLHEPLAGVVAFLSAVLWIDALFVFVGLLTAWLLAGRKRRTEIFFGLLIGVMVIGGQLLPRMATTRWGRMALEWLHPYLGTIREVLTWTPLSVWTFFFEHLSQGDVSGAYLRLLAVSAIFVGLMWGGGYAVFTRLATSARASSSQSARGKVEPSTTRSNLLTLKLPLMSEQLSVIFAKELLYLARNTATYLNTVSVLVITLLAFSKSSFGRGFRNSGMDVWDSLRIPFWVAYTFTINAHNFVNSFGFDASGFRQYLLAPLDWKRLLLGKNLANGLLACAQVLLILVGAQVFYQDLNLGKLYIAFCAILIELPIYSLVGNFISINFASRAEFGVRTRRSNDRFSITNAGSLIGLLIGSMALMGLPFLLSYLLHNPAVKYYALAVIAIITCTIYVVRINSQSSKLEARRFEIAEALTRKTEKI